MESNIYQTKDLYLASYLQLKGFAIQHLEKLDKKFAFIFGEKTPEMQVVIEEFYGSKARVEPMEYALAMKQVKSKIYNFS